MCLVAVGQSPYPVDQVSQDTVFVSTRGKKSILPVNFKTGEAYPLIDLPHKPRSTTRHQTQPLALVGGADKSQTSVIDTSRMRLLETVGDGSGDPRRDFGGTLACGHPAWVSDKRFVHLDRIARRIELYSIGSGKQLKIKRMASLNLPTSPHHVVVHGRSMLVMCEGNQDSLTPPSVAKIKTSGQALIAERHTFLPVPSESLGHTGGHHLSVDSTNKKVYVGTADTRLYTLDSNSLDVLNYIDAGKGCGHVTLCPVIRLGVTTNHTDTFMTVFSLDTGRQVNRIEVSRPQQGKNKTQGHTSKWFARKRLLYTSAAQDGKVLAIDVAAARIKRRRAIPGAYLIQGCFVE